MAEWRANVESITDGTIVRTSPLTGGCCAEVRRVDLADGRSVVAKVGGTNGTLDVEGFMLGYLARMSRLPVPRVIHAEPSLLLIEFVEGSSRFSGAAEAHAADLLAGLHGIRGPSFGFERDTLIGPMRQPNAMSGSWTEFFRTHRLLHMAGAAFESGHLPEPALQRLRALADSLGDLIHEPAAPALLHGDVWATNVLALDGRVVAFLDPAIYYGHPEAELAYITLFGTFGGSFFDRYRELHPIRPGFFERRRHIYNLYPLLVHTALFGGGYAGQVAANLALLGF